MDIVIAFKTYLTSQKNPPTAITVKNYLSDVRKFLTWHQETFNQQFTSEAFTSKAIAQYQAFLQIPSQTSLPAAKSAKRYISSLRKFAGFLEDSGAIAVNPFALQEQPKVDLDPLFIKAFKNQLSLENASQLTIKNYLVDIKQFLDWLERVTTLSAHTDAGTLLTKIDNDTLEEYKNRLYTEAKLSPVSINRKLSSLRKYTRWLTGKGIINIISYQNNSELSESPTQKEQHAEQIQTVKPIIPEPPLTALQGIADNKDKEHSAYSSFAPIRLTQKTTKIINLGSDLLFFNPIATIAETIHYTFWKKGKKEIFTPVSTILESSSYIPPGVSIKTIIPKETSMQAPRSANLAPVAKKVLEYGVTQNPNTVHNFTKALYAPLKLSTKQMTIDQKIWHHLRYSRPKWYKKYHTYPFVNYLHYAIMMIATVIAGAALFQAWTVPTETTQAVLSAQETAPPRTLAFQGKLLDKTNTPITTESTLKFSLYNSPTATGAALLWQEKQNVIPDHNGYFTATLGKISRLDQSVFTDNASLYLGISVNGNQELAPRQQIPTANYAANTEAVEGLKPITDNPDITQNVLLSLDSAGNLTIGGSDGHAFQATGGQLSVSGQTLLLTTNAGSNGNVQIAPDGSGIIDLQKPLQNTSNYSSPGGIPGAVEVKDILSVLATTSSQSALVVNQNGSGDIISARNSGIDKFSLDNQGNAFFAGDIIIKSDTIDTTSTDFDLGGSTVQNLTLGSSATTLALGGVAGTTTINNNLTVHGSISANGGITVPSGQSLTIQGFTPGAIAFVGSNSQLIQDASSFAWDDTNKALNINGSLCVYATTACDSTQQTPGTIYSNSIETLPADLAENYVSSQNLEPGDLVVPEGQGNTMAVVESTLPYQHNLIGIISTNPGVVLNSDAKTDPQHPHIYPLALQGRVPVKVSSINGPIQAGDNLTSSSIPGVAQEASGSGQIIGKALESYTNQDPKVVGKIMVFVNLSYQTTPATLTDNGNLAAASQSGMLNDMTTPTATPSALANMLTNTANAITAAAIEAQNVTTQTLQVATDNITIGGKPLNKYITQLVKQLAGSKEKKNGTTPVQQTETLSASISASLIDQLASSSAITIDASNSALLDNYLTASSSATTPVGSISAVLKNTKHHVASISANTIFPLRHYNSIASSSATAEPYLYPTPTIAMPFVTPEASISGIFDTENSINTQYEPVSSFAKNASNFSSDYATFNQGLIALGPTSLTDVAVSNMLSINNNLKITNNSLDTISTDLNIESLRQGNINFMGGLVAIDTQGNVNVKGNALFAQNVTVQGQLAAGIIAPVPNKDLVINLKDKAHQMPSSLVVTSATGSGVLSINQSGDVQSSGEANFNTVATNGFSIVRGAEADTSVTQTVSNNSAGKGTIAAHETERTIFTPYVTAHSLIYITATSNTSKVTPYLARQTVSNPTQGTQASFTVAIPSPIAKDVTFNWWIVN